MLDRIFDLIDRTWHLIIPWVIIEQFNEAVRLRFGLYKDVLRPGFHFKFPIIDAIDEHTVVPTTLKLSAQSLYSKDNKPVVAEAVIKYRISNIKVFTLSVFDAVDALVDMSQGIIIEELMSKTWEELVRDIYTLNSNITRKVAKEAEEWGLQVYKVTLTTLSQTDSIRVISDSSQQFIPIKH